ncbi:hypothetical protein KC318_g258 [Hortaea werneckii]|nr:hypothetical protein KC334_g265 [Hortaea werneckii]KAI7027467.1 hypothetical protein KC355_g323 [Hortaea werneckii]KAI7205206.1 hypothetical protein KC324_g419 [Hortaea werneckii]KAI7362770.1 hypothetical protein KC354_g7021 [Hortaea werneckii]KAI7595659.1 hypothetical protein KC316_g389 [Hortaea werneckii]
MNLSKQSKQWRKNALEHFEERKRALLDEKESVLEENLGTWQKFENATEPLSFDKGKYSLPETQVSRLLESQGDVEESVEGLKYLTRILERNMAMDANGTLTDYISSAFSSLITVGEKAEKMPEEKRKERDPQNIIGQLVESAKEIMNKHGIKDKSKAKASSVTPAPGTKAESTPAAAPGGADKAGEKPKPKQSPSDGKKPLMGQTLFKNGK